VNDGDFQSSAITWAWLEVSHYFGDETEGTRTVKIRDLWIVEFLRIGGASPSSAYDIL